MDKAPPSGGGDRRFESCLAYQPACGSGNVLDIVRYYRNAMGASGWEPITAIGRNDIMMMTFMKKAEMCHIQVNRAGWSTEIIVHVGEDIRAR